MAVTTTTLAIKDGTGASQTITTATNPAGDQHYVVTLDEAGRAVYRCTATFVPVGTADRTLISFTGSSTKTCRISKVLLYGTVTTTAASTAHLMSRTTALGTGGTAVTPTIAKLDSGTVAAATAVVTHYTTAAQSLGSGPVTLSNFDFNARILAAPGATSPAIPGPAWQQIFPEINAPAQQSIVVRGTSDFIEIGNKASNAPASLYYYLIEWTEDAS